MASEFGYASPPPADSPVARAQYWTGSGPMRVLPGLAPSRYTVAFAVTDDDRVGGAAQDAQGRVRPVIWTCAARQAFVLPGTRYTPQHLPAPAPGRQGPHATR